MPYPTYYDIPTLNVALESVLGSELALLPNGKPAILVEQLTALPTGLTGLACFIQSTPEPISAQGCTADNKAISEVFVVNLVQYNRKKSVMKGLRLIQKNFPIYASSVTPQSDKYYEQAIIRIKHYLFI